MRFLFLLLFSLQIIAQDISWVNNTTLIRSYSSPRATDLNNDGIKDIVLGGGVDGFPSPYGVIAIDGSNGNTIWTVTTRNEMFASPQFFDYNNDNIDDVLIAGRDAELRLIDGSNGNLIWEFWDSENTEFNDAGWYNFYTPQIIEDQNGDGFPDILAANGGDHSLDFAVTDRPPGHIMIIDGLLGTAFKTAVVPDSNETYLSPVISDLNGDGNYSIIFGTGGESVAGNLWIANLSDLMQEDLSNATALIPNSELGHIAPPSLGDLNYDGFLDIVTQGFDGKLSAINGNDLSLLWQYEIENTESSAAPILGKFSSDNGIDVFATIYSGSMSSYNDYYQVLLNGENGSELWIDSIGMVNFCSPIAFDSNNDNIDEVLISVINNNGSYFQNDLVLVDFNDPTQSISQQSITDPIAGGNVASTPLVTDLDDDGLLDVICTVQADSLDPFGDGVFYENGINTYKIETNYDLDPSQIAWGSYMGTNYDGHYNDICNGDLGLFAFPSEACPGQNNAMINLYVSSGTPPYTYQWSNGEISEDLENLGPGLYTAIVTDSNGICATISREVTEYGITSFSQAPSCPGGDNGFAYFNSTGCDCNTSFCQFIWVLDGDTIAQGDGSSAAETYKYLTNIESGTYTATIIHPDGCEIQENIVVPEASIIDNSLVINECDSNSNGYIDLIVSEQDSLIQNYLWSTGDTTQDIFNLAAGQYSVIVNDTICTDTIFFEIENYEEINGLIYNNQIPLQNDTVMLYNEVSNNACYGLTWYLYSNENNNMGLEGTDWILTGNQGQYSGEDMTNMECVNGDWCIIPQNGDFNINGVDFVFVNPGTYYLTMFNSFTSQNCVDEGAEIEIVVLEADCENTEINELFEPSIFLDASNNLMINFQDSESYKVEIFDMLGKSIFQLEDNNKINNISLRDYSLGIYNIIIITKQTMYTKKILIK
ncbi:MAG: hypothetical protein CMD26_06165 [Flavobacteriales bacterium]|nr:hypothetical protein [Flavobacteriales bacterium]